MIIFVQLCRIIDKNVNEFKSSIGSGRTNESNEKGSLCCKIASKDNSV